MKNIAIYTVITVLLVILIFVLFPYGAHIDGDTGYYFAMAAQMAASGWTEIREKMAPAGYPFLLNVARSLFNDDFLKGALFINAISFSITFLILCKESENTEDGNFSQANRILIMLFLFVILLKQYFTSRIIYSAWVEAPFIAFSCLGLYFLGKARKEASYSNILAHVSLIFFIAAWYCKYVGIIGVLVFFFVFGLSMIFVERSPRASISKCVSILGLFVVLIAPGAIQNYLRTGNALGAMAIQGRPKSIFIQFGMTGNYLERIFEFFNNIFTHLLAFFYLATYPDLMVGIFSCLSALAVCWIFWADFCHANESLNLINKVLLINHIEWYIWGGAYISAMLIKLLAFNFSAQAMSRYASLLIPMVTLFIFDLTRKVKTNKSHMAIPLLISIFTVNYVFSMCVNLPDYSRVPEKVDINNYHNIKGYPEFKEMQQMLHDVEAIYFLPRRNHWPLADKFYALFPCKEFYVARDYSKSNGGYNERIYSIPKFNIPYAVVSDYEIEDVLRFIGGKNKIFREATVLGFSICLVEPSVPKEKAPLPKNMDRSQYLGHGFISHGCR